MAMYIVIFLMRRVFSYFLKKTIAMHSSVENESTEQYTTIQVSVKRSQNLAQPKKNHGMIISDSNFHIRIIGYIIHLNF